MLCVTNTLMFKILSLHGPDNACSCLIHRSNFLISKNALIIKYNILHTMYAKYVSALHLSSGASTYEIFRFSRPWHDTYHSRLSSAMVKNMYGCTFTFHLCLHGVYRGNFTLTCTFELHIVHFLYSSICI